MTYLCPDRQAHAIMFHHFSDVKHPAVQGSISADQFSRMLDWLEERYRIVSAREYVDKVDQGSLGSREICLTFDDALLCQAEVAAPILKHRGLEAFFFVYSSPFSGKPDYLEVYRYFRTTKFRHVDAFYGEFFEAAERLIGPAYEEGRIAYDSEGFLNSYAFYTANDKWFRYLRDKILDRDQYARLMSSLMRKHEFDPVTESKGLWMTDSDLTRLHSEGHIVGLHSYSHPTMMHRLSAAEQELEYSKNMSHLTDVLKCRPVAMSHPAGRYNSETLDILARMGIRIGFRSDLAVTGVLSHLEIPRQDHANVLVEMSI
jgi:peptidoglycan/xylan/chitin deacetylase (PgdA/CDA1 family)